MLVIAMLVCVWFEVLICGEIVSDSVMTFSQSKNYAIALDVQLVKAKR